MIYTGPTTTTAEAQIDVLNGLIARGGCDRHFRQRSGRGGAGAEKRCSAASRWSHGTPAAPAGRQIHLNPSNNALIGETNVKLAADALQALNVEKGEVAVLSATPTSTNQNIWIEEMKRCYRSIRRCSWSPSPTVTICRIKATAKRWVC